MGRERARTLLNADTVKTDAELVHQTRRGETVAFEALVRRWTARVTAFIVCKIRNRDVAEDLAQETLVKAYRSIDALADAQKFGTWLFTIANHVVMDWKKAKARTEVSLDAIEEGDGRSSFPEVQDASRPEELSSQKEESQQLMKMVYALPEPLRQVVLIYYYGDVTYEVLGEMLGVSKATVNARLTKARKILREQFENAELRYER